jgi:23S rRNA pseudouridine2605 synthase
MIKKNRNAGKRRNSKGSKYLKSRKGKSPERQQSSLNAEEKDKTAAAKNIEKSDGLIRLNKYIADAGVCSRREADTLIASGAIKVNGKVVSQVGTKVKVTDKVQYGDETLNREALMYILLNKPKDFITTTDDPQDRKTVMSLVKNACKERIYPVGRLDRNTTGLLLFTNDGDLSKRLLHPSHQIKKLYHAELDKPLTKRDLQEIAQGVTLEDGKVQVNSVAHDSTTDDKKQVGIEIHSGQNRVVRRIFEHFGYEVKKLDRVVFGPLTKKDLPRSRWRYLTDKEILMLKKF